MPDTQRTPMRVELEDALTPGLLPEDTPPHVVTAMATVALHFAAIDLRSRLCPDCGTATTVVEDDDHGGFNAYFSCPPHCPHSTGLTANEGL